MKQAHLPELQLSDTPGETLYSPEKLTHIKVKDYALIGLRDLKAEQDAKKQLDYLVKSNQICLPRIYTLISQNRKIPLMENLSNSSRVFQNLESFKWSELYFNFFKYISHSQTEKYVFKQLLYSLDTYVNHFQLIVEAIKNSTQNLSDAVARQKRQTLFLKALSAHPNAEELFLIYIFDLILIAIGKNKYAHCWFLFTNLEAKIFLNYFASEDALEITFDRLQYFPQDPSLILKKYFNFRGQILLTSSSKEIFNENLFSIFRSVFDQTNSEIDHKTFESCFTHR